MSHKNSTQVKTFLFILNLTHLCLLSFHPEVLLNASTPVGPLFDIFASTSEKMPGICDWSSDHHNQHCYFPLRISKPYNLHVRCLNSLDWTFVGPTLPMRNHTTPPSPQISPAPEPHQTFHFSPLLAKIPSPWHIRLFLHYEQRNPGPLSSVSVISTFTHIRSRKRGCAMQRLIIRMGLRSIIACGAFTS